MVNELLKMNKNGQVSLGHAGLVNNAVITSAIVCAYDDEEEDEEDDEED